MALSITRRRFIVRLSIERGSTTIAAIDGGDTQVRDEPRVLALDTLRSLAVRNALRGLAMRTAALVTDHGTGTVRPPRPILGQAPSMKGPGELRRHNEDGKPGTQFQLRVAVTVGPVVTDMTGLSGKDIIRAARMLDTPAFKKAMTRTGSALGVITSAFVHDTAIETGPGMPGAADFAPVRVQVKESRFGAWVRLFEPPLIDVA